MSAGAIDDIVRFWFEELTPKDWYRKDDALDAEIARRFGAICEALKSEAFRRTGSRRPRAGSPRSSCSISFPATCSATIRAPSPPMPKRLRLPSGPLPRALT